MKTFIFTSFVDFVLDSCCSYKTMYALNTVKIIPWPASPNITPKRNGNVIIVYKAK